MNVYYAGPAELAGPVMGRGGVQENLPQSPIFNPSLTAEALMWSGARHHLLQGVPVLFCSPRRVIGALGGHLFGSVSGEASALYPAEPALRQIAPGLRDLASEVFEFMQAATRPSNRAPSALFINDLGMLLGAEGGARSLACSLEAYIRYAPAVGAACYLSCEDPDNLSSGLRRALASHAAHIRFRRARKPIPCEEPGTPVGSRRSA